MTRAFLCILALLFLAGCHHDRISSSTKDFPKSTGFIERDVTVAGSKKTCWFFVPPDYDPNKKYPAILFLHGLFEGGNGGETVLTGGLGPVIRDRVQTWPFITIFPQSAGKWQTDETDQLAMAALLDAQQHYNIDPERIILAGLSYGGLGVWEIGARHHDLFAAMVPVSGFAAKNSASMLTDLPIWAFADRYDDVVDPENTREMIQEIRDHGGRAQITLMESVGHDAWPAVVENYEIIDWMLNQRRSGLYREPTSGQPATTKPGGQLKSLFGQ